MVEDAEEEDGALEAPGGDDPVVEACLTDALGPYAGALSAEELSEYRSFLAAFITTHPVASQLHQRLRARHEARLRSTAVRQEGTEEAGAPPDPAYGSRKDPR